MNFAIPSLQEILSNQFLIGGVGTIAIGALGYLIRSVPQRLLGMAQATFSTSFSVTTRYKQYDQVAVLLQRYAVQAVMRNFAPAKSNEMNSYYRPKKMKKIPQNLAPGYGSGWAIYERRLVHFHRAMLESKGDEIQEQIKVRFFTRDVGIVSRFLHESETVEDGDFLKLHIQSGDYFGPALSKTKRELSSVFMAESVKGRIVDRFQWFLDNENWYRERGIPYKFCAILHGPPGTGKTSLVHALATHFDLAINYVNALSGIAAVIAEANPQDLIVIEDVDTLAAEMNRDRKAPDESQDKEIKMGFLDAMILHRMLNAIDGFCTPHGLKVIMTTNHVDRLDPALLRAGRTDLLLEIGHLGRDEIRTMFRAFYGDVDVSDIDPPQSWKGADLQEMFLQETAEESKRRLAIPRIERAA